MRERETRRIGLHRQRPPNRSPLPAKQGNRRRADRPRLMPVRRRRRRQPTPGDLPRETQAVEPQRVVFAEPGRKRSEEHTSELQSPCNLVCRLLLEKKKQYAQSPTIT